MPKQSFDLSHSVETSHFEMIGNSRIGFESRRLSNGVSNGVHQVTLTCGEKTIDVLPTRGMGIWQASNAGIRFGWNSPVAGPVHPLHVPISEPSGLGWLDGFDEMMVRCGMFSNGAPEFDDNHQLTHPLHGRVANLPAIDVRVVLDTANQTITIHGTVDENRFHFWRLRLTTEISLRMNSDEIAIHDTITNRSDRPTSIQMLYHNNFGPPILEAGSQIIAPITKLVPRNEHAANGISNWSQFDAPAATFAEQVYFAQLATDDTDHATALLVNADRTTAASIRYDATNLPCFSIWKNTVGQADGYVAGLEPATNFPNPKSFEEAHGRVVGLRPGASRSLAVHIGMLVNQNSVEQAIEHVNSIGAIADVAPNPTPEWCS